MIAVAGPSEAIRGMVIWILRDVGYECMQASSGSELVDILESQPIALAVIDVISPEFETPPAVPSARPPIILLLENGQIPGEVWRSANIFSLVIKPFSAGQIISCVTSALPRTGLIL